ncbi:unnamed protein product [Macrosiphum euphorbiae]|uniref:Uncharacterized protein n=1 Tax=Macrosiphum euphorbiae TaxID=13131 RepID=A0AAV0W707_9HEMI|nr:unnamed protein product [Macrosiphum euphorbiae]CAI6351547.1 unnamed protein product [Macrosiphum euphorbiae]
MSELTSIIMICCFELIFIGKFVSQIWRFFFDSQLSIVLTKLETIHEKLIRLSVVGPIKIKMNWIFIIGIIVNVMRVMVPTLWMISVNQYFLIQDMVTL